MVAGGLSRREAGLRQGGGAKSRRLRGTTAASQDERLAAGFRSAPLNSVLLASSKLLGRVEVAEPA